MNITWKDRSLHQSLTRGPFLSAIHPKMNFTVICSVVAAYSSWLLICDLPTRSSPTCMRIHTHICTVWGLREQWRVIMKQKIVEYFCLSACLIVCTSNYGLPLSFSLTHIRNFYLPCLKWKKSVCVCVATSHSSQLLSCNLPSHWHTFVLKPNWVLLYATTF